MQIKVVRMARFSFLIAVAVIAFYAIPGFSLSAGENLVKNGDLNTPDPENKNGPQFWQQPDGKGVVWISHPDSANKKNMVIRFDTRISEIEMVEHWKKIGMDEWVFPDAAKNSISDTYGLSFYSVSIPVEPDQAYRLTFDFKGTVGEIGQSKMWVRGYADLRGRKRRIWETIANPYPVKGKQQEWRRVSQVFFPTKLAKKVTEMKVMLYACYPASVYYFDNIVIEKISQEEYKQGREKGAVIIPITKFD